MMQASKLNTVFQVGSCEGKVDKEQLLSCGSFDTAQDTSGVLDCRTHCCFSSTRTPEVLLCKDILHSFIPTLYSCLGLPLIRCRALHLAVLNFIGFTWSHISILFKSLWLAPLYSSLPNVLLSLVLLTNLLRVPSIPLSVQKESC